MLSPTLVNGLLEEYGLCRWPVKLQTACCKSRDPGIQYIYTAHQLEVMITQNHPDFCTTLRKAWIPG